VKSVLQVLRDARAFLGEGPHRWCKGTFGRNAAGQTDDWHVSESCCAVGAIYRYSNYNTRLGDSTIDIVKRSGLGVSWLDLWNDAPERTYEEVLEAFDRAIVSELNRRTKGFRIRNERGETLITWTEKGNSLWVHETKHGRMFKTREQARAAMKQLHAVYKLHLVRVLRP